MSLTVEGVVMLTLFSSQRITVLLSRWLRGYHVDYTISGLDWPDKGEWRAMASTHTTTYHWLSVIARTKLLVRATHLLLALSRLTSWLLTASCRTVFSHCSFMNRAWCLQVHKECLTRKALNYFLFKPWRLKGFLQFKIIITVLVSSFRFIWIPMLWIIAHYKYVNSFIAVIDFRRQNLTSTGVRFWRLKSIPALWRLRKKPSTCRGSLVFSCCRCENRASHLSTCHD